MNADRRQGCEWLPSGLARWAPASLAGSSQLHKLVSEANLTHQHAQKDTKAAAGSRTRLAGSQVACSPRYKTRPSPAYRAETWASLDGLSDGGTRSTLRTTDDA